MFYVYEWFVKETGEIIYVGKGSKKRYLSKQHNSMFKEFLKRYDCESRVIAYYEEEADAFQKEFERIYELKQAGQCVCNIHDGGYGGGGSSHQSTGERWTEEARRKHALNNVMKSEEQRRRMSVNNPMKDPEVAARVTAQKCRPIIVGNRRFESIVSASKHFGVSANALAGWPKRGFSPQGERCFYEDEGEKKGWKQLYNLRRQTNSIQVLVDGQLFCSMKAACEKIGVSPRTLSNHIKEQKPIKGHFCVYANQQPSHGNSDKSTVEGSTTNE